MSYCTHCLQRLCRKHPLQDHGERANKLLQLAKISTSKLSVTALIQTQIEKLEAEAKGTSTLENDNYRNELENEREKINSLKRKVPSSSSNSLTINSNRLAKYSNSGLNPSVLSVMIENSDSDDNNSNHNSSTNSSYNNNDSNSIHSNKNKHSKKKDKKSKHKKSKKKKKHKKN